MSDHADVIREYLECPRSYYGCGGECCNRERARAALLSLVAEQDEANKALIEYAGTPLEDAFARAEAAEARVTELEAALQRIASKRLDESDDGPARWMGRIARAALAKEDTA